MADFVYLDFVKRVVTAAQAHRPPVLQSAIKFIADEASKLVARGDVVQVGDDLLTGDGGNAEAFVLKIIAERTGEDGECFLLVPKEVVEVQDDTWTSGSVTKQGARYSAIRSVFGKGPEGDKLAKIAFEAEAALYGTRPGSTVPGIAPGTKPPEKTGAGGVGPRLADVQQPADNPWNREAWRSTEKARQEKMQFWLSHNTAQARKLSHDAGCTLDGRPLHATKYNF